MSAAEYTGWWTAPMPGQRAKVAVFDETHDRLVAAVDMNSRAPGVWDARLLGLGYVRTGGWAPAAGSLSWTCTVEPAPAPASAPDDTITEDTTA